MAKKHTIITQFILGILTVAVLSIAASFPNAFACGDSGELDNCKEVEVSEKEEVLLISENPSSDSGYSLAESTVSTTGLFNHSRFLAGNEVTSSETVAGIEFLAGNLVSFEGNSEYGIFAGNSIKVSGSVIKDLFAAGNAIELTDAANIGRDVFAAGSAVLIKTNLNGNVFVAGDRLVLENVTIAGDLNAEFDEIVIKGKSSVAGTFRYNSDANITGLSDLSYGATETTSANASPSPSALNFSFTGLKILSLLGRLLVTIIFVAIASKTSKKMLEDFSLKNSWKELGIGLGLIIFTPIAIIFALVSIVGIPLAIISAIFYGLFIYFSASVTGGIVGDIIAKKLIKKEKLHILAKYSLGILVIWLLSLVPVIGGLVNAVSVCFGFGYLTKTVFTANKNPKKESA